MSRHLRIGLRGRRSAVLVFQTLLIIFAITACDVSRPVESDAAPTVGTRIAGARVEHVKDGDSFVVVHDGARIEVRLFGIDAPEKNQPYAQEARRAARRLMDNRTVDLVVRDRDRYQRLVADVYVNNDPVSVNQQLVAMGAAWAYTRYATVPALVQAQELAEERGAGLWSLPESERVAPWVWRKMN